MSSTHTSRSCAACMGVVDGVPNAEMLVDLTIISIAVVVIVLWHERRLCSGCVHTKYNRLPRTHPCGTLILSCTVGYQTEFHR